MDITSHIHMHMSHVHVHVHAHVHAHAHETMYFTPRVGGSECFELSKSCTLGGETSHAAHGTLQFTGPFL